MVFDVLSGSTGWFDQIKRLRDYDGITSTRQYVCRSQDEVHIGVWTRGANGRHLPQEDITDIDAVLEIAAVPEPLRVRVLYDGTGVGEARGEELPPWPWRLLNPTGWVISWNR